MRMAGMTEFGRSTASLPGVGRARAGSIRALDWRAMLAEGERFGWDVLTLQAAEPNPFCESWFVLPAAQALDPGKAIQLLRFESSGRLAGLVPVTRQRRYYGRPIPHLATWVHDNCFLGAPLVAAGDERAFWIALLDWADRHAGSALFLHLRRMPLTGPVLGALQEVLQETGRQSALVQHEERALLASSLDAEAYFEASLTAKKRKELRRQHARLAELGTLSVERLRNEDGLGAWIDEFLALELAGWKGQAGSALASENATARHFAACLHGAAQCGRLERLALRLDGRAIAMLVNFLTPPGAYAFKTTFDESYARFSPGVLLQRENLALLDDGTIAWADSCAAADHPMIERIWRERRAIGSLSIAIGGAVRRGTFRLLASLETRNATEPRT
jgi:CelD/BcsL family acetyltransferase involved in cellulose biosynthesis